MSTTHPDEHTATRTPALGVQISVRLGRGTGPTTLAAFDAALREAGVADRNLIRLSSVIPPGATIDREPSPSGCAGQWGDRLYVVMAEERVERPHEEAWAGIAWCQDPDTGEGLFVEHHGHSQQQVESDLTSSLTSICAGRPARDWSGPHLAITGTVCVDEPVCALAVATFDAEPWVPATLDLRSQ